MTTNAVEILKGSGLAKSAAPVRELAGRLERARQTRNERVARADADYVDAVRRALAALEGDAAEATPSASASAADAVA
jgi:hypothetical protein